MVYRLFVAIDLPENARFSVQNICTGLKNVKWVTEDQIHLTLRFLGDVQGDVKNDICEALADLESKGFSLKLKGVGYFPPRGNPKVLWAGVEESRQLGKLYKTISAGIESCGIGAEHRKYAPHITLARVKRENPVRIAEFLSLNNGFETDAFEISQYHLYSSFLTEKGAIHEKLATFQLD